MGSLLIYQAKAYGSPRRAGGAFADGFATASASLTGATVDLVNKKIVSNFTPGTDQTKVLGSAIEHSHYSTNIPSRAFDGNTATSWLSNEYNINQSGVSWIGWDFGSSRDITSLTIKQDANGTNDQTLNSIKVQSSNDLSTWTEVTGSPFTLATDSTVQSLVWPSVGAKRGWRVLANANVVTNGYAWGIQEITLNSAGTFSNFIVATLQASAESVSSVEIVFEYNPVNAISLNTDLIAEVTCDGSNYSMVTLVGSEGQSGRVLASGSAACSAGHSFGYRISSANNKNVELAGVSIDAT